MRIAFILERLGNGGAERVTAALATEFSKEHYSSGWKVAIKQDGLCFIEGEMITGGFP